LTLITHNKGLNMKVRHELKVIPCFFEHIWDGSKPFEIRRCIDRTFQRGDKVVLKEYDSNKHVIRDWCYTGRYVTADISFVTQYLQQDNSVVFGLQNLKNHDENSTK
jgi:hypothetical protein